MRAFAAAALAALAVVACGSAKSSGPSSAATARRALAAPACSTAVAPATPALGVRSVLERTSAPPFGVVTTPDGRFSFVTLPAGPGARTDEIAVFDDRTFVPRPIHTVPLPGATPFGLTLTHNGRYLLAADGDDGAAVISVSRAERGSPAALLGTLRSAGGSGAIEVVVSNDDRYAFVSLEDSAQIAVFDLAAALRDGFRRAARVGTISVDPGPVGMAVSPDGRLLYATSELRSDAGVSSQVGTLSVIDVRRAQTRPGSAVTATVSAGCNPVRVIASPDGRTVWVTARASDRLLGFSAAALADDPSQALLADVLVGEAPVGLALTNSGTRIVVADSNRFQRPGRGAQLTVVDPAAALAGRPAVIGKIRSGAFPREMSLEPDGTLLVSNFGSDQLQAIDTHGLG